MGERLREIPVASIDRGSGAFVGADGNRYFEVECNIFVREGAIEEGTVACHGSGSHGGHIVLKPFYRRQNGRWVSLLA